MEKGRKFYYRNFIVKEKIVAIFKKFEKHFKNIILRDLILK